MIRVERGELELRGSGHELMTELTIIIRELYQTVARETSEDFAKEMIAKAGRLAFAETSDLVAEAEEAIKRMRGED